MLTVENPFLYENIIVFSVFCQWTIRYENIYTHGKKTVSIGHANIIKYCNRPFETVSEMNQYMIDCWNEKVSKEDKVFVLGDFALGTSRDIIKWGRALKGNKTLILGNHDRASKTVYLEAGFQEVIKYPILWNEFYILSHAPKCETDMGKLYNIFGHVHNDVRFEDVTDKGICVSVERTGYAPISFKEIQKKIIL